MTGFGSQFTIDFAKRKFSKDQKCVDFYILQMFGTNVKITKEATLEIKNRMLHKQCGHNTLTHKMLVNYNT